MLFNWASIRAGVECANAATGVESIVNFGKAQNKPIILGNTPKDKASDVDDVLEGPTVGWSPPDETCLNTINAALTTHCTLANNCYLIDLYQVIESLKGDGIEFEEATNKMSDFRLDGVHLTERGVRYNMKLIDDAMKEKLPECALPSSPPPATE